MCVRVCVCVRVSVAILAQAGRGGAAFQMAREDSWGGCPGGRPCKKARISASEGYNGAATPSDLLKLRGEITGRILADNKGAECDRTLRAIEDVDATVAHCFAPEGHVDTV